MVNETDLIYAVPEQILDKIPFLITILQAVGILVILYIIFWIIKLYIDREKKQELIKINKNLEDIKLLLIRNRK